MVIYGSIYFKQTCLHCHLRYTRVASVNISKWWLRRLKKKKIPPSLKCILGLHVKNKGCESKPAFTFLHSACSFWRWNFNNATIHAKWMYLVISYLWMTDMSLSLQIYMRHVWYSLTNLLYLASVQTVITFPPALHLDSLLLHLVSLLLSSALINSLHYFAQWSVYCPF